MAYIKGWLKENAALLILAGFFITVIGVGAGVYFGLDTKIIQSERRLEAKLEGFDERLRQVENDQARLEGVVAGLLASLE